MAIGSFIMGMMGEPVGYRMIYVTGTVPMVIAGALCIVCWQMKKRGEMPLVFARGLH